MLNRTYNTRTTIVYGVHVCVYCGKIIYGYRQNSGGETYYNCCCDGAQKELTLQKQMQRSTSKYEDYKYCNYREIEKTKRRIKEKIKRQRKDRYYE